MVTNGALTEVLYIAAGLCNRAQTRLRVGPTVNGTVMPLAASSAAVVVPAPATLPEIRFALPAVVGSPFPRHLLRHVVGRVLGVVGGCGEVLIVAYAFPLAILAIGIPIVLFVRVLVETGRALWQL